MHWYTQGWTETLEHNLIWGSTSQQLTNIFPYLTVTESHITIEVTDEHELSADILCTFLHPLSALALLQNYEKLL